MLLSFAISFAIIGPSFLEGPYKWLHRQGVVGMVYFVLIHAVWILLGLPSSLMETLAGFMYGFLLGFVPSCIGRQIGVTIAYFVAKRFGSDFIEELQTRFRYVRAWVVFPFRTLAFRGCCFFFVS